MLLVSIIQFGIEKLPDGPSLLLRGSPDEQLSYEEVRRFFKHPTPYVFEMGSVGAAKASGEQKDTQVEPV